MANPERRPSVAAAAQRGKFESWDRSAIHAPLRADQIRPGRLEPGANVILRVISSKLGNTVPDPCQRVTHRNWYTPRSSLQNDPMSQSRRWPTISRIRGIASVRESTSEYPSCGVLDSKPPLVILEAGDVVEDDHSTLDLALVIPQGSGVDQHP